MEQAETPLERAIRLAEGMTALAKKLNERGKDIKGHATVYQWKQSRVPSDYCPDIEAITGVKCEELRPDVNWAVLRGVGASPGRAAANDSHDARPRQDRPLELEDRRVQDRPIAHEERRAKRRAARWED